jgi:hypothetical protein
MPTKEELEEKYLNKRLSTWELAKEYCVWQSTVRHWLIFYDIPRRSYKENKMPVSKGGTHTWGDKIAKSMIGNTNSKIGKDHWRWTGNSCGYGGKHSWMVRHFGSPNYCEHCRKSDKKSYDWANISGEYKRDKNDWLRLCKSCHKKYDRVNKLK